MIPEKRQYPGPVDLFKIFSAVRTFENIRPFHVEALNLQVKVNVPLDRLVPIEYLPSSDWEHAPSSHDALNASPPSPSPTASNHPHLISSQTLSNGAAIPSHETYFLRKKELLVDNDTCYKSISNQPGQNPGATVRLVHYRKFYETLMLVGGYWDTSLDNLPEPGVVQNTTESPEAPMHSGGTSEHGQSAEKEPEYTGRRIDTGRKMPESFRIDLVRTFIEPIIWSFGCRAEKPQIIPRLQLQGLLLPVRHNALVYSAPKDRMRSRAGILEGPVLAVQCRPETIFDENGAIADLLREVGAMLLLGEQREREGKQDPMLNQSEWWATERRWGGGTGTAVGEVKDSNQAPSNPDTMKGNKRMARAMDAWRTVRGPASRWDRKVTYLHIGKSKKQQLDHVSLSRRSRCSTNV